jgi:hypothetical protein
MSKHQSEARIALDLWRAEREGTSGLVRRQERRLSALLAHARTESPFYRHLYRGLPADGVELRDLPPVTKPELMAAFDDWVRASPVPSSRPSSPIRRWSARPTTAGTSYAPVRAPPAIRGYSCMTAAPSLCTEQSSSSALTSPG